MKLRILFAASTAMIMLAGGASAAELFNQNLASPGVYFGTGNANGAFATDTQDGVEIGLRSKISGIFAQITPVGDTYAIPIGHKFNFDYSVNPSVGGSTVSLAGAVALIKITDVANHTSVSFDPSAIPDNAHDAGALGGYQNSEKISFGFIDPTYNPNQNDTFLIDFTLKGLTNGDNFFVDNKVVVGTGAVPEPATWAMMLVGFGGLGAAMRSRRKLAAAA